MGEASPAAAFARLQAGQVFAFKTQPYTAFSPPETGRYAGVKVIGKNRSFVVIAILDGAWSTVPTEVDASGRPTLAEHRFEAGGRTEIFGISRQDWSDVIKMDQPTPVGRDSVSADEEAKASSVLDCAPGSRIATLRHAISCAEAEWRWANDREAFLFEVAQQDARNKTERTAREDRYRTRLRSITLREILSENLLDRWHPSPPYPPEGFTSAARARIVGACEALDKLGPKPGKAEVRSILKETVLWLNEADEAAGGVIETDEREDLFAVLEDMAHAAGQPALVAEIDMWRTW